MTLEMYIKSREKNLYLWNSAHCDEELRNFKLLVVIYSKNEHLSHLANDMFIYSDAIGV